jgi:Arc/MetJ-type ribon-helix-helix transcriptional regulator
MTVESSILLTDDQHSFAKTLVDSGRFPSVSAVMQQGIELVREKMEDVGRVPVSRDDGQPAVQDDCKETSDTCGSRLNSQPTPSATSI